MPQLQPEEYCYYLPVLGILLGSIGMKFGLKRETNSNYRNGVPKLLILRLLEDKEMSGCELVKVIRNATGETIILGEGVVYPVLHMFEREDALTSKHQSVSGRSCIYYSLTPVGEKRIN